VFVHSYELSLPTEVKDCYPELLVKQPTETRQADPRCEPDRNLCLSDVRVRELVADKIEEVLRNLPHIDGYVYSFHESQLTRFSHFCDQCKHLDRFKLIQWLYESIREGAVRVRKDCTIVPRLWGIASGPAGHYTVKKQIAELIEHDSSKWFCRRLPVLKRYHYRPGVTNPRIEGLVRNDDSMLMYKATWSDFTLNQPLNKWACSYGNAQQVVELSLEHCRLGKAIPLIVSRQHQAMIRKLRRKNISFCIVPVSWGMVYSRTGRHGEGDDTGKWGLNILNLHLLARLIANPDISLAKEARSILRRRYDADISPDVTLSLLETADIMAKVVNVNGVSSMMNLDCLLNKISYSLHHVMYYTHLHSAARRNGQMLISPDDRNLEGIFREKDEGVADAEALLLAVTGRVKNIPASPLKRDLLAFFSGFYELVEYVAASRKRLWIEYKLLKEKTVSYRWLKKLDELNEHERLIVSRSKLIGGLYAGKFPM